MLTLTVALWSVLVAGVLAAAPALAQSIPGASAESAAALARGEWPAYQGPYAATRYSPLAQITAANAKDLRVTWRWTSPDDALRKSGATVDPAWTYQSTPLMVNGILYVSTSLSQVAAVDAAMGTTKWVYDPKIYERHPRLPANIGWLHRGVAYWRSGDDERVFIPTAYAYLIALDAKTGRPVSTFGTEGWVDLTQGLRRAVDRQYYTMTSPPVVVNDVVVVGSSVWDWWGQRPSPPGDVRGFDARTGRQLWTFKTTPEAGEPGVETWERDSWREAGNTNVWAPMSADEELGYVYLPVSTPTNDYYGGHRPGDGLYGESLVCIEAKTGRKVWHYQIVRHGLWDYDLPAAPNLVDVTLDGRRIKAVAQVTKQAFVFVFDRVTGRPLWPIEDRAVPQSAAVPGEKTANTQPFPTRPAPVDLQGVREEDLIDLTPELKQEALAIIKPYDYGPLYTPPSERGAIAMPGVAGGPSWSGAAVDPETGWLYVQTGRLPHVLTLRRPRGPAEGSYDFIGGFRFLSGPRRLPLFKPPFGSLVAIDMNTGEHRWRVPFGTGPINHEAIRHLNLQRLGWPFRGWALPTKTVLFAVQQGFPSERRPAPNSPGRTVFTLSNLEPKLYVHDKATGALIAEIDVPQNASGSPITYLAGGKQYVVFPAGGSNLTEELIAVALP